MTPAPSHALPLPPAAARHHYGLLGPVRTQAFEQAVSRHGGPCGWLPASGGLIRNLCGWENVVLAASHFGQTVDAGLEQRLMPWLKQLGYDETSRERLMKAAVETLSPQEVRQLCVLRTLLARSALVLVPSEWFAALGQEEQRIYGQLFDEALPAAAWLALGAEPPPEPWRFVTLPVAQPSDG